MEEYDRNHVSCEARAIAKGDLAILVDIDGDEHWIPDSQVHDDSEVYQKGDEGTLIITKYIAKKRGLWED